jgi:hypothetical protein
MSLLHVTTVAELPGVWVVQTEPPIVSLQLVVVGGPPSDWPVQTDPPISLTQFNGD